MPRRPLDTSRAVCDTCGKPYEPNCAVYSIADRYDETNEEVDVLLTFRHWECHVPVDKALAQLREKVADAQGALDRLKRRL